MRELVFIMILSVMVFAVNQKAHIHGEVELEVAFVDKNLVIEMHAPLMDIVNYGHKPITKQEKKTFKEKLSNLREIHFYLDKNALCKELSMNIEDTFKEHDEHKEEKHDEHDEHDEKKHNEIQSKYVYSCKNPNSLKNLNTKDIFKYFPTIQKIHMTLVTNTKQYSSIVSKKNTIVKLR